MEKVQQINPSSFTEFEFDRLNQPLPDEIEEFNESDKEGVLKVFIERYQARLTQTEKRYAELQTNLATAERKVDVLHRTT